MKMTKQIKMKNQMKMTIGALAFLVIGSVQGATVFTSVDISPSNESNIVASDGSLAVGYDNDVSFRSLGSGLANIVDYYSSGVGYDNTVGGISFATGSQNNVNVLSLNYPTASANGRNSAAMGENNTVLGFTSFAFGKYNDVDANRGIALGSYLDNTNDDSVVVGKYNEEKTGLLFSVGNGTGDASTDRSNAVEIFDNGDIVLSGKVTLSEAQGDIPMYQP